jgi:hypothetical protein
VETCKAPGAGKLKLPDGRTSVTPDCVHALTDGRRFRICVVDFSRENEKAGTNTSLFTATVARELDQTDTERAPTTIVSDNGTESSPVWRKWVQDTGIDCTISRLENAAEWLYRKLQWQAAR